MSPPTAPEISTWVTDALASTPVYDLHTHLYPAGFGPFMLWGIDELLTYHYLIAEIDPRLADSVREVLGDDPADSRRSSSGRRSSSSRAPISEACRGVVTALHKLGLDLSSKSLSDYREWYASQKPEDFVDTVFKLANVHTVVMTNDALDPKEREIWLAGRRAIRASRACCGSTRCCSVGPASPTRMRGYGYQVGADLGAESMKEIRRFLNEWIDRMKALYVAVSLTPTWRYPDDSPTTRVIEEAILPVMRERRHSLRHDDRRHAAGQPAAAPRRRFARQGGHHQPRAHLLAEPEEQVHGDHAQPREPARARPSPPARCPTCSSSAAGGSSTTRA